MRNSPPGVRDGDPGLQLPSPPARAFASPQPAQAGFAGTARHFNAGANAGAPGPRAGWVGLSEGAYRMWGVDHGRPILAPGSRIEVDFGGTVMVCRLRDMQGGLLHLTAPAEARRSLVVQERAPVRLTLYQAGTCLEAETSTREWIWMKPPVLVVGPLHEWREVARRRAPRVRRQLSARLAVAGGAEYNARTQDVSEEGVSLLVAGLADLPMGSAARLTVQLESGSWCADLPIRVARVRHWLRPSGRSVEIGARVELTSAEVRCRWQECLTESRARE
jgi:hypothetical protein